eukprot:383285-Rhodomonas_salina.2
MGRTGKPGSAVHLTLSARFSADHVLQQSLELQPTWAPTRVVQLQRAASGKAGFELEKSQPGFWQGADNPFRICKLEPQVPRHGKLDVAHCFGIRSGC